MSLKRAKKRAVRKDRSRRRQQRIEGRLRRAAEMKDVERGRPMLGSSSVHTEVSDRVEGHGYGGLSLRRDTAAVLLGGTMAVAPRAAAASYTATVS